MNRFMLWWMGSTTTALVLGMLTLATIEATKGNWGILGGITLGLVFAGPPIACIIISDLRDR